VLFAGASGVGKSTLTVSFSLDGYAAWCDDAVFLDVSGSDVIGRPISRKMRLRRGTQLGLFGSALAAQTEDQRLVYSCQNAAAAPPPVSAIFIIEAPGSESEVSVQALSLAAAAVSIISNSFACNPEDASEAARRMKMASGLVARVPVFALRYPRDFAVLPDVRREVIRVVSGLDKGDPA